MFSITRVILVLRKFYTINIIYKFLIKLYK